MQYHINMCYNFCMEKKYYVYILECADKTLYCGYTNDLEKRIDTHNSGQGAKYTSCRRPVKLVYSEIFDSKSLALKREYAIKQLSRKEKLALCAIDKKLPVDTNRISGYYKQVFGTKVVKISLNGGFTCPNRDGKLSLGGCTFCSEQGSGDFAKGLAQLKNLPKDKPCLAYLQSYTNTYAPLDILKEKYQKILSSGVNGLIIGTRPDCIDEKTADYLEKLSKDTFILVELGLQSIHEKTTQLTNRHCTLEKFLHGYNLLKSRNIKTAIHIINGLPYETKQMMIETAKFVNDLTPFSIKIHSLGIIKGTKMAIDYETSPWKLLSKEEYIDIVCDQLELLNPNIYIDRLTGDAPKNLLIAPLWSMEKIEVLNGITKELKSRNSYQGKNHNK